MPKHRVHCPPDKHCYTDRWLLTAALAAGTACSALLSAGCSRGPAGRIQAAEQEPARTRVAAVRAELKDLSHDVEMAAEFRPYQEVDVHAKVAGYLKSINVDVGDHVAAGREIAVLEVPEFAQELAHAAALEKRSELDVVRARADVDRAQSAYDIRKLSYDRITAAAKARPNLVAQQEIDSAGAHFREAEAQLATAKALVAAVEQQVQVNAASSARVRTMLGYLRIVAPFSGMVTRRYADNGAMIQAGTASQTQAMPVVRIAQIDRLRLVLPVPESIVYRIRAGNPVEVRVDSLQRVFQGRVARFTGQLSSSTRTMDTEVDIPNPAGVIKPGMYGYASIVLDRRRSVVAVPVQAVVHGEHPVVYVIGPGGEVQKREVKTGLETPNSVEILSGLREDELVLIGSRSGLKPGTRVDPKILRAADLEGGE